MCKALMGVPLCMELAALNYAKIAPLMLINILHIMFIGRELSVVMIPSQPFLRSNKSSYYNYT
jgi:hypothetical protein